MEKIVSLQNSKVKKWTSLHEKKYRDKEGLFLVENEHMIEEALKNNAVKEIILREDIIDKYNFDNTVYVSKEVMKKICNSNSIADSIAVCFKSDKDINELNRVILLDGVQDPGNLGTIIRSAVSFGFDAMYISNDTCDIYNDKCLQATQGAIFKLPVLRGNLVDYIEALKEEGFNIVGTSLKESNTLSSLNEKEKMAFVFGNEGNGVSEIVLDKCDENIFIEIGDFESLNVAVATGIVLYKFRKLNK